MNIEESALMNEIQSEETTFYLLSETSLVKMSRYKDLNASLPRKKIEHVDFLSLINATGECIFQ